MNFLLLLLLLSFGTFAQDWMPHDISVLFPRPKLPLSAEALTMNTVGRFGVLIPSAVSSKLPLMEPMLDKRTQRERFEVVGIRIEPPEIRLVWGVYGNFAVGSKPRILALDTALHSFYRMEDEKAFMAELKKISLLTRSDVGPQLVLSVHPTLEREGPTGEYGQALRSLILNSIGEKNLFKFTFMSMAVSNLTWEFGGFLVKNSKATPLSIPKINTERPQLFLNDSFPATDFKGGISPAPKDQNAFNRLVSDSLKAQASEPKNLREAHGTALRIENPLLENSDTIDCASCHLAQHVRLWTQGVDVNLQAVNENRYVSAAFNLQNKSPARANTTNVHAFGWFADTPSVNQRVINESAQICLELNGKR